jgi:hypothetical protein
VGAGKESEMIRKTKKKVLGGGDEVLLAWRKQKEREKIICR